jgi:hypothetical protein
MISQKMKRWPGFAAVALSAALSACVNLTPDSVYPLGTKISVDAALLADADAPIESTIRTAKSGDVILQQSVRNSRVFVLENSVVPDGDVSLAVQARTVDLQAGLKFFPAINLGSETALVLCSFERPSVWTPRLNPGAKGSGRVCFRMEDLKAPIDPAKVSLGDSVRSSSVFFFVTDGFGLMESTTAYRMIARWDPQLTYKVTEPARFRPLPVEDASADGAPNLALRFVVTAEGARLEPVYLAGNQPMPMKDAPITIKADEVFPKQITFDGATIELMALKDGVLAYRLLSGFSTEGAFLMDLPS